jgi:RNA polymerase sigma factor (sigma-70 family)
MRTDADLLLALTRDKSPEAFRLIVERYLEVVYAAARRQAPLLADDVTQAVFLLLWQRSAKIRGGGALAGWLVNATRLAALEARRAEQRRRRRETVASRNHPLTTGAAVKSSDDLAPFLDHALGRLGEEERTAVVLRYLENKSLAEVAATTGISEAAAAKRVSRGLDRLRRAFRKQGREIPVDSLALMLGRQAQSFVPPASLSAKVLGSTVPGANAAGAAIAKGVLVAMTVQKTIALAAGALLLVLLVGGGWYAHHLSSAAPASDLATGDAAPAPAARRLKVGVVVSTHAAAELLSGRPRGYNVQIRIAPDLDAPDIDLTPIIESGSENDEGLKVQIEHFFRDNKPILDSDAAGLRSLDVIVAAEVWAPAESLLAALDSAVADGVPFFNDGLAENGTTYNTPLHPARNLAGMVNNAHFASTQNPIACVCIENHPILGDLWGFPNIALRPLGIMGELPPDAKPLIKVANAADLPGSSEGQTFYPLYISHYGKGAIVACTFAPYKGVPEPLVDAGRSQFFLRCVHWLADQRAATATPPASQPAAQ